MVLSILLPDHLLAACESYHPMPLARSLAANLYKAVIRTPKGKDGRVDYDAVPVGATIWVSVSDPASPLHGRPIMITKRPDKKFALTGGAGWEHHKDGDASAANQQLAAQRGRKHLVLEGVGNKPKAAIDDDTAAKLAEKRKEIAAASAAKRKAKDKAARGLLAAAGFDPDEFKGEKGVEAWRERTEADAVAAGLSKGDARRLVGLAVNEVQKLRKRAAMQKAEIEAVASAAAHQRGDTAIESHISALIDALPSPEAFVDEHMPISGEDLARLAGASPQEAELQIKQVAQDAWTQANDDARSQAAEVPPQEQDHADLRSMDDKTAAGNISQHSGLDIDSAPDAAPDATNDRDTGQPAQSQAPAPARLRPLELPDDDDSDDDDDETAAPAEPEPAPDPEREARAARIAAMAGAFADYHEANTALRDASEQGAELRAKFLLGASTVENLRQRLEGLSDGDMERLLSHYTQAHQQHAPDAFYTALRDHWNTEVGYSEGIGQYAASGAASAITGLVGTHLGSGVDVSRLIENGSIETAAAALAMKLRSEMDDGAFDVAN